MITNNTFFRQDKGNNGDYSSFMLIGTSSKEVIDALNILCMTHSIAPDDVIDGIERAENGYSVIEFKIYDAKPDLIYFFTKNLHCKGYADTDHYYTYTLCADHGKRSDDYTAQWNSVLGSYDENNDLWDSFVTITDPTGIKFETGAGAVDEETMFKYKKMVTEHPSNTFIKAYKINYRPDIDDKIRKDKSCVYDDLCTLRILGDDVLRFNNFFLEITSNNEDSVLRGLDHFMKKDDIRFSVWPQIEEVSPVFFNNMWNMATEDIKKWIKRYPLSDADKMTLQIMSVNDIVSTFNLRKIETVPFTNDKKTCLYIKDCLNKYYASLSPDEQTKRDALCQINDFFKEEYNDPDEDNYEEIKLSDFNNLSYITLAYSTDYDDYGVEHVCQAYVNLIDYSMHQEIDGIDIITAKYNSIKDLFNQELKHLSFDDLISVNDNTWVKYSSLSSFKESEKTIEKSAFDTQNMGNKAINKLCGRK